MRAMPPMTAGSDKVVLVGLDFGSTTTSMLAMQAEVASNCATGRMELRNPQPLVRAEPIFTPVVDGRLDLAAIRRQISRWLAEGGIRHDRIFAGGAIVTGLAAQRDNAESLAALIVELLGDAVVATADDPRLEAWLAFMGGSAALSRAFPGQAFINLDIGGGTTNPAVGVGGNVSATGCYFVGARHFEFEPGGYCLRHVTRFGRAILDHLAIARREGDTLSAADVGAITDYFVGALVAMVEGDGSFFGNETGRLIAQRALEAAPDRPLTVTFSGGVGELVYAIANGAAAPPTTFYGDLGIDLALAILDNPRLARDVRCFVPEHRGRATVQGLTLNNTEISGNTLFLSDADALPLRDLPVVASLSSQSDPDALSGALQLAGRSQRGACIHLVWDDAHPGFEQVKGLGEAVSKALDDADLPDSASLVILTTANVGKALGNYATRWRTSARRLIVIDEIPVRDAQFVNLGRLQNGIVPVSFYGMV